MQVSMVRGLMMKERCKRQVVFNQNLRLDDLGFTIAQDLRFTNEFIDLRVTSLIFIRQSSFGQFNLKS
jgi:hypothetical protein